jgi:radical SAM-linked protein
MEEEATWEGVPDKTKQDPPPVQRVRFRIGRGGVASLLSHLEMMNAWVRALRRSGARIAYSQGFHAHPKVSFPTAPPVGEESTGDWMDVVLEEAVDPQALLEKLQAVLPEGFEAYSAEEAPLYDQALMAQVRGFHYDVILPAPETEVAPRLEELMQREEWIIERMVTVGKRKTRGKGQRIKDLSEIDVRASVDRLEIVASDEATTTLRLEVHTGETKTCKARDVAVLLGYDGASARIIKRETLLSSEAMAEV